MVIGKAVGKAAPGTKGPKADDAAFLAAVVSAVAEFAQKTSTAKAPTVARVDATRPVEAVQALIQVVPQPRPEDLFPLHRPEDHRSHLELTLPGDLAVTVDTWTWGSHRTVHTATMQTLRVAGSWLKTGLPLTLTVMNGTLVAPAITMVDLDEIRAAIAAAGLGISARHLPSSEVEATVSETGVKGGR